MSPDTLAEVRRTLELAWSACNDDAPFSSMTHIERALALLSPEQAATPPAAKADDPVEVVARGLMEMFAESNNHPIDWYRRAARDLLALLSTEQAATPPAAKADDLVEVVARALCVASGRDPDALDYKGKRQWQEVFTVKEARAVLSALDIPRREAEAAAREQKRCAKIVADKEGRYSWGRKDLEEHSRQLVAAIRSQPAAKAQGGQP